MLKKFSFGLVVLLTLAGIWYFFIKSYDYKISFQTTAAPGSIYLRALHFMPDRSKVLDRFPYESLVHRIDLAEADLKMNWQFIPMNDSVTRVETTTKTIENNFLERLKLLVGRSDSKKRIAEDLKTFRDLLEKDVDLFDVEVMGEALLPEAPCACITLESPMEEKATGMMQNIGLLQEYMKQHNLDLEGYPRVQVTKWDTSRDHINFDFCFPLAGSADLPKTSVIRIRKIQPQKALKAVFRGNYIFSHHAWLQLLNYAEMHGYEIVGNPLEIFIDNPELGGNSRQWEAEVFLPVR